MNDTGNRKEVEPVDIPGVKIKVKVMTLVRGKRSSMLVECSRCGPVAVDTTGRTATTVGREHLLRAHNLAGAPA